MAVYNTRGDYLKAAIESILNQSFEDFEFIIVNDASTDETNKILDYYTDKRIVKIENKTNLGLTISLNKALRIAKGEYIARMDSDDISLPDRLKRQLDYMKIHREIVVLGSWARELGTKRILKPIKCLDHEHRRVKMLFRNSGVIHPTAMIRGDFLKKHGIRYDEEIKKGQDYALWSEIINYGRIENMEIPLLEYRVHPNQISVKHKKEQDEYAEKIKVKQMEVSGMPLDSREIQQLVDIEEIATDNFAELYKIIKKIMKWNDRQCYYHQEYLEKELLTLWLVKVIRRIKHKRDFSGLRYGFTYRILWPSNLNYFIFSIKNHEV